MEETVGGEGSGATMADQEPRLRLQVRTLTGASIALSVSPDKTVHDLKLLLLQRFSPAIASPTFHLFLRGVKLGLKTQLGSLLINSNEFLVLVPFTKKGGSSGQNPELNQSGPGTSEVPLTNPALDLAQSTWSEVMGDFSCLRSTLRDEEENSASQADDLGYRLNEKDFGSDLGGTVVSRKRRKPSIENVEGLSVSDEVVSIILQSVGRTGMDDEVCQRFAQVLESVNCFSDKQYGKCMIADKVSERLGGEELVPCACPPWLRVLMKAFAFVNIFSGCMLAQLKRVTGDSVSDTLDKLRKFGFSVSMEDLNHLSALCPKVVSFFNDETQGSKSDTMLIMINLSRSHQGDAVALERRTPLPRIINSVKKREVFFRKILRDVLESHMFYVKDGYETLSSLGDLMTSIKEAASSSHVKQTRKNVLSNSKCSTTEMPCNETRPLSPFEMIEHLRNGTGAHGQVVHVEEIDGKVASFSDIPDELSPNAKSCLQALGITKLYSHQVDSIEALLSGKNVVVATTTSSGKSLCYNLPVLEVMSQNMLACALYVFPTKAGAGNEFGCFSAGSPQSTNLNNLALAQDQMRALWTMTEGFGSNLTFGIYDGDTPQSDRMWLRDNARLLITNPDMLHMSILPVHRQFQRILSNLRFIVIDEAHTYKGPFGCHTALVLRRLRRICSHVYGSDPSFVFCTATSTNPCQHAMNLANLSTVELIKKDGSPSGPKQFVLWNPPLRSIHARGKSSGGQNSKEDAVSLRRSSPIMEVSYLLAEMVQHGLRSIAFCKTRKLCELVLSYTREILKDTAPHLMDSVGSYRSGYVAKDRRRIESEFFGGKICGIAATNALELGIDVGHIDVTLHLGFPGSIASLWQQVGRSGRRGRPSVAVYVAFEGALDQYFMKYPMKLFGSAVECCHVDAQNSQVLQQHLLCAAFEHPLSLTYDEKYFGPVLKNSVVTLTNLGCLSSIPSSDPSARMWTYIGKEKIPSRTVNIRSMESERYKVIDKESNEVLEEIEESRAFFQVYDGAVYMNQGKTYLVQELDLRSKIASCQRADLKYYTKTRDYTDIHVVGGDTKVGILLFFGSLVSISRAVTTCRLSGRGMAYQEGVMKLSKTTAQAHSCTVTTTWFGFFRLWKRSNEIFDSVELSLPKFSYESQAVWVRVPQSVKNAVMEKNLSFYGGLHAASHAVLHVVPLYIICNTSDLASECINPHDNRYMPERILLYDQHPGGTGLSLQIQPIFSEILDSALQLLTSCHCTVDTGCPNCIQSLVCHEFNEVLNKDAAIMIIKGVLESEKLYFEGTHDLSGTA